jgi:chemotaxis protein MotB
MSGGGHKRRHEEHEEEEHENHERWLVSYADMMTLLMVLFIVLFAISQVDQKKFAALKSGLSAGFGAPVEILPGADSLLDPGGSVAPDSLNLAGAAGNRRTNPNAATAASEATVNPAIVAKLATATEQAQVKGEVSNLKKAQKDLQNALKKAGLKNGATFRFDERGLVVTIATDNVLFHSGSASLEAQGTKILNTLAPTLRSLPNQLSIDGHTNNIPIHTAQFPSNWELSGDRASGVLRYLHSHDKIPYNRMSATGHADTEPRLPASNPKSVSVNRRVEIVVLARVDDASGRAIAKLGNTGASTTGK